MNVLLYNFLGVVTTEYAAFCFRLVLKKCKRCIYNCVNDVCILCLITPNGWQYEKLGILKLQSFNLLYRL